MPINPSALSSPEPDETPIDAPTQLDASQREGETSPDEPAKRTRRTKAQMIADATIPGDAEMIEVKDVNTGAKVERAWREVVPLVESGAVEFVDKSLKYAVMKQAQQAAASAFDQPSVPVEQAEEKLTVETGQGSAPPESSLGDEVRIGSETLRVGHGGTLTSGPIADADGNPVRAMRRWQRELGAGLNGPWQSTPLTQTSDPRPIFETKPEDQPLVDLGKQIASEQNGNGVAVESERQPAEIERMSEMVWKVGTGILEKIGLPDYSSLQIGPISASRMVVDDGRRTTVTLGDRQASVPTAVIEVFREAMDVTEYIARHQRGELVSFLESTGALKQPAS